MLKQRYAFLVALFIVLLISFQAGIADDHWMAAFRKGLRGLLPYVSTDYDVFHTCKGCLCPRNGTKLDYAAVPPVVNDPHAFGPLVLSFGVASQLGIKTLGDI